MPEQPPVSRPVDHLVLPVDALVSSRERYRKLGFTVAADAQHPFGTENACVFFIDGTYLEPLAIGEREVAEEAARTGNAFVARDLAFRFRRGEGLSAVVFGTRQAAADDEAFRAAGVSGGQPLAFSREMKLPDGRSGIGSFRLSFAADFRAPDFFFFTCQRVNPLPADRSTLEVHENGVTGLAEVILTEPNPTDFQYLLQVASGERRVDAGSFGMRIDTPNVPVSVLTPAGLTAFYGLSSEAGERGLRGAAIRFSVADLGVTERLLAARAVPFIRKADRLIVPKAAGQGVAFIFGD